MDLSILDGGEKNYGQKPWDPPPFCVVKTVAWLLYIENRDLDANTAIRVTREQVVEKFPWLEETMARRGPKFVMDDRRWMNMICTTERSYTDLSTKPLAARSMQAALHCLRKEGPVTIDQVGAWYTETTETLALNHFVFIAFGGAGMLIKIGRSISPSTRVKSLTGSFAVQAVAPYLTEAEAKRAKMIVLGDVARALGSPAQGEDVFVGDPAQAVAIFKKTVRAIWLEGRNLKHAPV